SSAAWRWRRASRRTRRAHSRRARRSTDRRRSGSAHRFPATRLESIRSPELRLTPFAPHRCEALLEARAVRQRQLRARPFVHHLAHARRLDRHAVLLAEELRLVAARRL